MLNALDKIVPCLTLLFPRLKICYVIPPLPWEKGTNHHLFSSRRLTLWNLKVLLWFLKMFLGSFDWVIKHPFKLRACHLGAGPFYWTPIKEILPISWFVWALFCRWLIRWSWLRNGNETFTQRLQRDSRQASKELTINFPQRSFCGFVLRTLRESFRKTSY